MVSIITIAIITIISSVIYYFVIELLIIVSIIYYYLLNLLYVVCIKQWSSFHPSMMARALGIRLCLELRPSFGMRCVVDHSYAAKISCLFHFNCLELAP